MLTAKGRLGGDLTVACLAEDRFVVIGSGVMQNAHRRWFEAALPEIGVAYRNLSADLHGIALSGPSSRDLLAALTRDDVSAGALRFRDSRETIVGGVPVLLNRISFSGELGYEIYTAPSYLLRLAEEVERAGVDHGLRWYGARALMSLRLEKSWGVWGLDYRPDFTAGESGLDVFIDWTKDFVGKEAALRMREEGPSRKLVTMRVETDDIDVSADEAILRDGEAVGYVSSGGFAHNSKASVAMGYVPTELAQGDTALEVEINGERYPARILGQCLWDANGGRMRS